MKISIAFIVTGAAILLLNIEASTKPLTNKNGATKIPEICNSNGVWYQGKVPYVISQQFGTFYRRLQIVKNEIEN